MMNNICIPSRDLCPFGMLTQSIGLLFHFKMLILTRSFYDPVCQSDYEIELIYALTKLFCSYICQTLALLFNVLADVFGKNSQSSVPVEASHITDIIDFL